MTADAWGIVVDASLSGPVKAAKLEETRQRYRLLIVIGAVIVLGRAIFQLGQLGNK